MGIKGLFFVSFLIYLLAAAVDEHVGTGCCPPDPAFEAAMHQPNATGVFPFAGLDLDTKQQPDTSTSASLASNWTWSTSLMEVALSETEVALNQVFTLDIPLDVDLYNPSYVQQDLCVVLLDFERLSMNDPGTCANVFQKKDVERMRRLLIGKVRDTRSSPCKHLKGLYQDILGPFNRNPNPRNTTTLAQYHFTSATYNPQVIDGKKSPYDAALVRTKPIFLLSYPTNSRLRVSRDTSRIGVRFVCVRVMEERERGGDGADSSSTGFSMMVKDRIGRLNVIFAVVAAVLGFV